MRYPERTTWITDEIFTAPSGRETLDAWRPFGVAHTVLFNLQNTDIEPRWHGWLIPWVAGLTVLRSTGHVLAKIDAKKSPRHAIEIKRKWDDWSAHREENWIFWDFINKERNNVIKEFEFGFTIEPYLEPDEYEIEPQVDEKIELFREAVYWWRAQLREIEALVSA